MLNDFQIFHQKTKIQFSFSRCQVCSFKLQKLFQDIIFCTQYLLGSWKSARNRENKVYTRSRVLIRNYCVVLIIYYTIYDDIKSLSVDMIDLLFQQHSVQFIHFIFLKLNSIPVSFWKYLKKDQTFSTFLPNSTEIRQKVIDLFVLTKCTKLL